jgi:DNA-binding MarR family transcriptional regulator
VPAPQNSLSYELHKLTARLDRAADALLRDQADVSYSRFLALFAVTQGAETQRELSRWLGQSEPSTSRMVGILAKAGWLDVSQAPGSGNRRKLRLTESGSRLVASCAQLLETRFSELVARSGVMYGPFQQSTRRLLAQLDEDGKPARAGRGGP